MIQNSTENPEVIQVSADHYRRLLRLAGPSMKMLLALQRVQKSYDRLKTPTARDVLQHAAAALGAMNEALRPLPTGRWMGLPIPLILVHAELLNVQRGRTSGLFAPAPANERGHDSSAEIARLAFRAYAVDAIRRLIEQGCRKVDAAKKVAKVLEEAGFRAPGGRKAYSPGTLERLLDAARKGVASFQAEYDDIRQLSFDATPDEILAALREMIDAYTFSRE